MSGLDVLLLVVVGASAIVGLLRGFVAGVASIVAWLLGGWAALHGGGPLSRAIAGGVDPGPIHLLMGYGGCFLLVSIAVALLAWLTRRMLKGMGLDGVDRGFGLALGLARGALVACMLVLLLGFTRMPRDAGWQSSAFVPVFKPGARWLASWLPDWAHARLDLDGRPDPLATPPAPL